MSTATLERPIAILYTGTSATWCKGGCGKFRYPYCHVAERPYCEGCAFVARLEPMAAPKPKEIKAEPAQPTKIGAMQLIPYLLEDKPLSSKNLAEQLGLCSDTINLAASKLIAKGLIVAGQRRGKATEMLKYYALPKHLEQLKEITGKSLAELILEELEHGAKTRVELQATLLNKATFKSFHVSSIRKTLYRLVRDGRVAKERNDNSWIYQLANAKHG